MPGRKLKDEGKVSMCTETATWRLTFDPSGAYVLRTVPLQILASESKPMSREIGRVGDDALDVGDVLRQANTAQELDVNVVEFEGVDWSEGVAESRA